MLYLLLIYNNDEYDRQEEFDKFLFLKPKEVKNVIKESLGLYIGMIYYKIDYLINFYNAIYDAGKDKIPDIDKFKIHFKMNNMSNKIINNSYKNTNKINNKKNISSSKITPSEQIKELNNLKIKLKFSNKSNNTKEKYLTEIEELINKIKSKS